ncbi:hypothetical protein [Mesorhizobium sp. B2-7-2]|uniref:hypothetical protein n=1 Tax=Mesorhizobium sp. B2-7-2 TaxID=2589908 RepID=UPI00112780E5|nr:hypothetical protein [Mesorhizobium sp. B2-7-2]TPJ28032.1 hypothetical protein FJ425_13405 [Mesorhizobium sp. B2-7-2]
MTNENEPAPSQQRRVYVLPTELVERIVAFQNEMGMPSEVEAARRLLDDALKFRDDWRSIVDRILAKTGKGGVNQVGRLHEAAKEIIVGHPLVTAVTFEKRSVSFRLLTGEDVHVFPDGTVLGDDASGDKLRYGF